MRMAHMGCLSFNLYMLDIIDIKIVISTIAAIGHLGER